MPRSLRLAASATAAALSLFLVACGSSGGGSSSTGTPGSDGKLTTVKIAETAGVPAAFLEYGEQKGLFKAQGLHLDIDTAAGGAAVIPGVVSGTYQFGGSNVASVLLAANKGLPISLIAPGTFATEKTDADFSAVLVAKNSPITSAKDLAGKKIAVNTLKNIGDITIKAALAARGVDTSGISFVEIGFPDMLPALEAGRVDAAWEIEPFVSIGLGRGFRPVLWPYVESKPGLQIGSYVANKRYAKEQPKVVEAFQKGVAATAEAIAADPAAFRSALPTLQKVTPESAQKMILPVWRAKSDLGSLRFIAAEMRKYGLVNGEIDVDSMVAPGSAA
ncbi:NitT/TauT family transport system substrate-binding protein [Micromonospora rhizosphaerae]|uniref:NitT/TauT family transport system substrate-binding protein n=1 Tax=Micromonospora rhizosphaerae TaxID=568872 RepID=A0A1C6RSV9_9ACTN|nr:ABC transporter substrate-binding protein [Micromonospora rhizosphaerae]SCL20123.1 NitT/TauT family transport system substrate-binding protein [Micromonospora rhizosphaerae]